MKMAYNKKNIFADVDIRALKQHTTPVGIATSAFIIVPSTEYDENGQYFVRLKLKTDDKATQKLIKLIDDSREWAFNEAVERLELPKDKKACKMADPSYKTEEDEDGNETGYTIFNFKRKAVRMTKNGDLKPITLPLFDSMLQPVDREGLDVWSGSEIAVAFKLCPFYTPQVGAGVSHRLEAIQLIKVVSGGSDSRSATEFGFERNETGFAQHTADDEDIEAVDEEDEETPKKNRGRSAPDGDF